MIRKWESGSSLHGFGMNHGGRMRGKWKDKRKTVLFWLLLSGMLFTGCRESGSGQAETDGTAGYAGETQENRGKQEKDFTAGNPAEGGSTTTEDAERGEVHVRFLKTAEDADCIMINSGERAVIIDTGEERDVKRMLEALEEQGVTAVDYMILTHPDKDHVGGATLLLETFPVYHVMMPAYEGEEKKEERFARIRESCEEKGIPVTYPSEELTVSTGYLDFTVYPPQEAFYEKANNYSLAVLANHGEVSMFFTGDALRIRSEELMEIELPEIDLYKVPHHGRANQATEELFGKVSPKYAVVTAGSAEDEVIRSCEEQGAQLFLTGEKGWEFISDGKELRLADEG